MNYIDLIAKFWNANEKSPLGSSAIALYLFLLEEYRKTDGNEFSVSDSIISQKLSLTRPTINSIKSKLRNVGLIHYKTQSGLPCTYRIVENFSFLHQEQPVVKKQKVDTLVSPAQPKKEVNTHQEINEVITKTTEHINIPSLEEFMAFAKTLEIYDESLDFQIEAKYKSWVDAGWKNGVGIPLIQWQNNLRNTIPHLTPKRASVSINKIPKIERPKTTYDE